MQPQRPVRLTLCILGTCNLHAFLPSADFIFFKIRFINKIFQNCWQKLTADDTSRQRVNEILATETKDAKQSNQ